MAAREMVARLFGGGMISLIPDAVPPFTPSDVAEIREALRPYGPRAHIPISAAFLTWLIDGSPATVDDAVVPGRGDLHKAPFPERFMTVLSRLSAVVESEVATAKVDVLAYELETLIQALGVTIRCKPRPVIEETFPSPAP